MVVRDSGHVCGLEHLACKHRWGKKAAKQVGRKTPEKQRSWGPAVGMDGSSQPTVGQEQTAETKHQLDCLDSLWRSGSHSLHHDASRISSTRASAAPRPPQDTTDVTETEAEQRTVVLDVPSGSKEQEESEADDECLPPHFVDTFAGKNRPMSRAMERCGWTTRSFEKFPAEGGCNWIEYKCGKSKDVKLESVQTEVFNQKQAQATWIALDCRTLTKTSIPTPGQKHHYEASPTPLRSAEDLWGEARLEPSNSSSGVWAKQPLSAAERSLLLEQNELIAFVEEALKFIHEANESAEIRQLGIVENLRKSWLWVFDYMMLVQ